MDAKLSGQAGVCWEICASQEQVSRVSSLSVSLKVLSASCRCSELPTVLLARDSL